MPADDRPQVVSIDVTGYIPVTTAALMSAFDPFRTLRCQVAENAGSVA